MEETLMSTPGLRVLHADEGRRFEVFGSTILVKATAEDTRGAFCLALETTPPHGGLPLHVHHREDEAMYILEGEFEIQSGDQVLAAGAGTFVFLPRDVPNRYRNVGDTPGRFLQITSPAGFEELVRRTSLVMSGGPPDMNEVMRLGQEHGVEFI